MPWKRQFTNQWCIWRANLGPHSKYWRYQCPCIAKTIWKRTPIAILWSCSMRIIRRALAISSISTWKIPALRQLFVRTTPHQKLRLLFLTLLCSYLLGLTLYPSTPPPGHVTLVECALNLPSNELHLTNVVRLRWSESGQERDKHIFQFLCTA